MGVASKAGQGSRFHVRLPVTPEAEVVTGPEASTLEVVGLAEGEPEWRILVVEDDAENRRLLTSLLVGTGFQVREAEHGEQALAHFDAWRPHFIWLDMRMPVMDGYEAARRLRALPGGERVKIVALTASAFHEQRAKILASGCDDMVHKPYQLRQIFDAMAQQLGVRYRLEEAGEASVSEPIEVTAEAVAALPKDLREMLHRAALSLSREEIESALLAIRDHDPDLAEGLGALARDFRFDRILKLAHEEAEAENNKEVEP